MAHEFVRRRRVEFAETDAAGIVHFSVYFRYIEEAEHDFLRSLGLSVHPQGADGETIGFPRLSARFEYARPLRFEDEFEIRLRVARLGERTLTYQFRIEREGEEHARGEMSVACCRVAPGEPMRSVPLPESFVRQIETSPEPPLEFRDWRTRPAARAPAPHEL